MKLFKTALPPRVSPIRWRERELTRSFEPQVEAVWILQLKHPLEQDADVRSQARGGAHSCILTFSLRAELTFARSHFERDSSYNAREQYLALPILLVRSSLSVSATADSSADSPNFSLTTPPRAHPSSLVTSSAPAPSSFPKGDSGQLTRRVFRT